MAIVTLARLRLLRHHPPQITVFIKLLAVLRTQLKMKTRLALLRTVILALVMHMAHVLLQLVAATALQPKPFIAEGLHLLDTVNVIMAPVLLLSGIILCLPLAPAL